MDWASILAWSVFVFFSGLTGLIIAVSLIVFVQWRHTRHSIHRIRELSSDRRYNNIYTGVREPTNPHEGDIWIGHTYYGDQRDWR